MVGIEGRLSVLSVMFDITITIVAYLNYEDILAAVQSINQFTSDKLKKKLYIVDNSCYDDTNPEKRQFVHKLLAYDFVEYLDAKANLGFGAGHNYVLDRLNSRYHAIVNPDILLTEDAFYKLIKYMEQDTSVGMTIPKILNQSGELQQIYRREVTLWDIFLRMFVKVGFQKRKKYHTMQDMDYSKPFQVPFGQGSFLVIRTKLFQQLHGFDDRFFMYMEDADLCKRVNQKSKLMYYPGASVIHKWEKGSHKNFRLLKIHVSSMIKYFNKWHS